ncbi:MAG: glycoside hydrolase family 1 protein [Clostridia bacterium]
MSTWPGTLAPFLWGVASSSHQVEGHQPGNDWTRWEAAGKTAEPSGNRIDHWNHFREDVALYRDVGANASRISLEWSRLEPNPGTWDEAAFDHYAEMLDTSRDAGLEPLVTLSHFTLPLWVADAGGWLWSGMEDAFLRFVDRAVRRFSAVRLWCTINEPTVHPLMGYEEGVWPPGGRSIRVGLRVLDRELQIHRRAYRAIKALRPDALVGLAHHMVRFRPLLGTPAHQALARFLHRTFNAWAVEQCQGSQDYIGLNYYSCRWATWRRPLNPFSSRPGRPLTQMGWEVDPDGLYDLVGWAARRFALPILVTENGIATDDEEERSRYIAGHVDALRRAAQAGADVRGYFYWSGLDNFEWAEGYRPHFGLIAVGDDGARTVKAGAGQFLAETRTGFPTGPSPHLVPPPP